MGEPVEAEERGRARLGSFFAHTPGRHRQKSFGGVWMDGWRLSRQSRSARTGVGLALAVALTLALFPWDAEVVRASSAGALDDQEQAFLNLINQYRASQNPPAPALTATATLNYAARSWSLT